MKVFLSVLLATTLALIVYRLWLYHFSQSDFRELAYLDHKEYLDFTDNNGGGERKMAVDHCHDNCDFHALVVGQFLSCPPQVAKLHSKCGFIHSITATELYNATATAKDVNVFDTTIPTMQDSDLGAPHVTCGGAARVNGIGGRVDGPHPNCQPQGKALVIQNPDSPEYRPDDDWRGGCLVLDFSSPYRPTSLGILDVDVNEVMTIEVRTFGS